MAKHFEEKQLQLHLLSQSKVKKSFKILLLPFKPFLQSLEIFLSRVTYLKHSCLNFKRALLLPVT